MSICSQIREVETLLIRLLRSTVALSVMNEVEERCHKGIRENTPSLGFIARIFYEEFSKAQN